MKTYFIIITFFLSTNIFAQLPSQDCVSERWISIKMTPELKTKLKENGDLIDFVRNATFKNELSLFRVSGNDERLIEIEQMNYIYNSSNVVIDSIQKIDFFIVLEPADMPLVNDKGDPITQKNSTGELEYVYPKPKSLELNIDLLSEIRIKEIKVENEKTITYVPFEIGFYISSSYFGNEPFWVNLNDLYGVGNGTPPISGKDFFLKKEYKGFQYRQKKCEN